MQAVTNRRLVTAAALLLALPVAVSACASVNASREQARRDSTDGRLFVERAGAGSPTYVFLPGMTGSTSYWRGAGMLQWNGPGRVILMDELGFGRSPWPDTAYTLDEHLDAIERTLRAEGANEELILVGHSFGSILGVHYAARYPDRVRRLVLFGTPVYRSRAEARGRLGEMSFLAGMIVRNRHLAHALCTLHMSVYPVAERLAVHLRSELPQPVLRDSVMHFWPSLDGSVRNVVLGAPVEAVLPRIGPKVVFVHGSRDGITPMNRIREVASANGAGVLATDDDHNSYWRTAKDRIQHILEQ